MGLTAATWNINSVRLRLDLVKRLIEEAQPGVVCLQETKTIDPGFPRKAIRQAGYGTIYTGQSAWNGVAILAKDVDPVEVRRVLPGDASDTQPRYLEAAVGGVLIACIYAPNGKVITRSWFRSSIGRFSAGNPVER